MPQPEGRRAQWLRGVLDLCVLAALTERERYGYELGQRLDEAGLGEIKGGTLYPLLARLQDGGLVTARWEPGEHGPGRKYYDITAAGRERLAAEAASWTDFTARLTALFDGAGRAE